MTKIVCTDKNGNIKNFNYSCAQDIQNTTWIIRVNADPPLASGDFFELRLEKISDSELRSVMMHNYGVPEFSGAGIPDVMIPEMAKILDKQVVSSSGKSGQSGVYRTDDATKVWERLVQKGLAVYDIDTDTYRTCVDVE